MNQSWKLGGLIFAMALHGCASPNNPLASTYGGTRETNQPAVDASDLAHQPAPSSAPSDAIELVAVTFEDEDPSVATRDQASADQVVSPPPPAAESLISEAIAVEAPPAAGKRFLPTPDIPSAPSVAWPIEELSQEPAPLTLAAVESLACQNNPTLLQAQAQVQGTLGKAIQAGLWPNPTLIYSAEQIGVGGTAGEFHGSLVRQRIVTAHKLDLSREKYVARTRTAQWVALQQQYRVLNDVRMHYFRARGRQELVGVQQDLLKNAEDRLVTFREMHNVGQATRAEVHMANVQLQQQRLNLLMAENDFRQSIEELAAMTGVELAASSLQTPLAGELALIDWDDAVYRLLKESPQIAAARSKLEADRITIRREIAEPVPDIVVEGGAGYNFAEKETVGMAAVMLEVPVFDWNQGTIRQAEADYARQEGELRRTELLLRQQLAQQYRNYLTAVQHVRNYEQVILPEAQAAYDLRLQGYEADRAPWTDVLAAEQDYFQHRIQYIGNLIVWRESEVSIMGFLLHGGLTDPPNIAPPGHINAVPQPR